MTNTQTQTKPDSNIFTVETMTQVDANTVNFYGVASLTGNYMRCSFTARTRDDHAFLTQMAGELHNHVLVNLAPKYDKRRDEFWTDYRGWTFRIDRFFDWR